MNITLVGMSGAGKSYIGKALAEKLQYEFIDIDKVMEKKSGKEVKTLLKEMGDNKFIDEETKFVLDLSNEKQQLISPGGSVIYSSAAMDHLKAISKIIFLNTSFEVIEVRRKKEPAGIVGMRDRTFKQVYEERLPLYLKYADIVVNLDGTENIEDTVRSVLKRLDSDRVD